MALVMLGASRVIDRLNNLSHEFFFGRENEVTHTNDPLLDAITESPYEALWFIRSVLIIGILCGVTTFLPSLVYLRYNWMRCLNCSLFNSIWLAGNCLIQLIQTPIRCAFYYKLYKIDNDQNVVGFLQQLVTSKAWGLTKILSMISYALFFVAIIGVFLLGGVMIKNMTFRVQVVWNSACNFVPGMWRLSIVIILVSICRIICLIFLFYTTFPSFIRQGAIIQNQRSRVVRGLSTKILELIPLINYSQWKEYLDVKNIENVSEEVGNVEKRLNSSYLKYFYDKKKVIKFQENCTICLSDFDLNEKIRLLPCQHIFHSHCIDTWLIRCATCPLCQTEISEKDFNIKHK